METFDYAAFSALDPFFELCSEGFLASLKVRHYFDTIAENTIFEFRYDVAGWPKQVESRDALMALYRGYERRASFYMVRRSSSCTAATMDASSSSSTRSMVVSSAVVRPTRIDIVSIVTVETSPDCALARLHRFRCRPMRALSHENIDDNSELEFRCAL